jgi:bifunctional non-homologous end joining protein LigD
MGLQLYKKKRDFKDTPEPAGKIEKKKGKLIFVIQRHDASRLHYDFRLEAEGVLKSWAVPKGPSLNPTDKRLAVMVEDHPKSYASFEGDIPAGNYGAGHVDIWDNGMYEPEDENRELITEKQFLEDLQKGTIKFRLHGKKLKGSFALVLMKGRGDNNWLLIKHRDEYAVDEYDAEDHAKKSSKAKSEKKRLVKKAAKPVKEKIDYSKIALKPYKGADKAGVSKYLILEDGILAEFSDKIRYLYTSKKAGKKHVESMKELALEGKGLTTYINQNVREKYEKMCDLRAHSKKV